MMLIGWFVFFVSLFWELFGKFFLLIIVFINMYLMLKLNIIEYCVFICIYMYILY